MTFPITPILDPFNRPNEGPPPSANWGSGPIGSGSPGLAVVSNTVQALTGAGSGYWGTLFTADQECYLTTGTFGLQISLWLRITDPNTATYDGYEARFNTAANSIAVWSYANSVGTELTPFLGWPVTLASGDGIGFRAVGNTLIGWHKPAAGSWTPVDSLTDSSIPGGGYIGLLIIDVGASGDDFGGGSLGGKAATVLFAGK